MKHRFDVIHSQYIYGMRVREIDRSSGQVDSSCGIGGSDLVEYVLFEKYIYSYGAFMGPNFRYFWPIRIGKPRKINGKIGRIWPWNIK